MELYQKTLSLFCKAVRKNAYQPDDSGKEKIDSKGVWTPVIVLDPGHSGIVAGGYEPLGPGSSQTKSKDTSGTQGVATVLNFSVLS